MPFQKNNKLSPGRSKGSTNVRVQEWKQFAQWIVNQGMEDFHQELSGLKGKDFVYAVIAMMEYFKPKLSRTTVSGDQQNPVQTKIIVEFINGKPENTNTREISTSL